MTSEQRIKSIVYDRCYYEADLERPGYERFFSADRRFPIAISYPGQCSAYYDFNDAGYLHVRFLFGLTVSREDLGILSQRGRVDLQQVAQGQRDYFWQMSDSDFQTALSSFRWLSAEYFANLPSRA